MFTGIISAVGQITTIDRGDDQATLTFATGSLDLSETGLGDSIACNGACLTVVDVSAEGFSAELSRETLECTTFGELSTGAAITFEAALKLSDSLDGHLVTGHVDGTGAVRSVRDEGESLLLEIEAPAELARYIARKGSVCVDGVSLTVNSVAEARFSVMIVPHTQTHTIIANYAPGTRVNLEVDLIARYLERFLQYTDS